MDEINFEYDVYGKKVEFEGDYQVRKVKYKLDKYPQTLFSYED